VINLSSALREKEHALEVYAQTVDDLKKENATVVRCPPIIHKYNLSPSHHRVLA